MTHLCDTLKKLAEDAYLLASNYRTGNDEFLLEEMQTGDWQGIDINSQREWRVVELIVALGDRACALAGLDPHTDVWVPDDVKDVVG